MPVTFRCDLSPFFTSPRPARSCSDLRKRRVDHLLAPPYSSPRSKQSKHRREEIGRGPGTSARRGRSRENRRRPQGQTRNSGAPTKAARLEAEPPGLGGLREDEAGSAPGGTSSDGSQGSPAAHGAPQGEPAGGRRSERLRASRTRRARFGHHPRRAPRLLGAPEPERLRVAGGFGSRRARRSLGLFAFSRALRWTFRPLRFSGDELDDGSSKR